MTVGKLLKYISIHNIPEDTEIKISTNFGVFEVDWCQLCSDCLSLRAKQDYVELKGENNE